MGKKMPWRLGKHQRTVVDYLLSMNRTLEAHRLQWREKPIDWTRGGAAVTRQNLASLCGFELWSEAANLLDGLVSRGILSPHPSAAAYTLSQDAIKKLGILSPSGDERGIK